MKIEGFGINPIFFENNKVRDNKKKNTQNIEENYKLELSLDYKIEDEDYEKRLKQITDAIKNGTYSIDLEKLAKALIDEVFGK